ncbi:MAG: hypothetical protein RR162_01175 [Oscillospiraceae bacterium]
MYLFNRARAVLAGEQGGPSVETIIGIAVAMIMGVALIAFGRVVVSKTTEAGSQVSNLATSTDLS